MKSLRVFMALSLCFLALTATSCRATRPIVETSTRDTVERFTTIVKRDTVLIAPAASTSLEVPIKELLKGAPFSLKRADKQATVSVSTSPDGNRLLIGCNCDTVAITAELRDKYERERASSITTKTEKVPVPYVPWYISALAWVGGAAIVLTAFILAGRYIPKRIA